MTGAEREIDEAILTLHRLDAEARMGWPGGFDAAGVLREAQHAVAVLAQSVERAPSAYQAMLARNYVRAVNEA